MRITLGDWQVVSCDAYTRMHSFEAELKQIHTTVAVVNAQST